MAAVVRRVAARVQIPVVADGDTGHGGPHNVARTVQEFEAAGAAGVILEDQVAPKRCGHFQGKDVVPAREMVLKWRAAVSARSSRDFVLVARTDARDVNGLKDAIARANLYLTAGADVAFVESPHSAAEIESIARQIKGPLLVNMLTGGKTPAMPVSTLERWGYKIVVYPIESLMTMVQAVKNLSAAAVDDEGLDAVTMVDFSEIKAVLGLPAFLAEEKRWGGTHVSR